MCIYIYICKYMYTHVHTHTRTWLAVAGFPSGSIRSTWSDGESFITHREV